MTQKTSAFRRLLLAGGFAATFAAGGLVLPAAAAMQDAAAEHMDAHAGMGPMGMDHAGLHAMIQAHLARMLAAAQASPEQKARIHEILMGAMHQIGPLHQKLAASHQDLHRILTASTVDRSALEQLRAQDMADADQASRVLVQALADAAEVLTPTQRAKLAAAAEHHPAHPAQP
jgi:protein CpxP